LFFLIKVLICLDSSSPSNTGFIMDDVRYILCSQTYVIVVRFVVWTRGPTMMWMLRHYVCSGPDVIQILMVLLFYILTLYYEKCNISWLAYSNHW
jgi:hypothetical protein